MAYEERGVDVSKWNGTIDFTKLKKAGASFVIIKAGGSDYGLYSDRRWEENYKAATKAGLKVGAYYFAGNKFWGKESGVADAKRFINLLKGKKLSYPVYLDIEAQERAKKAEVTEAAVAFCQEMEKAGYFVGVYGSEFSTFEEMVYKSKLTPYTWWVANYSNKPQKCAMWQHTCMGRMDGIKGNVDKNISYVDFTTAIKKKGLNGYAKTK